MLFIVWLSKLTRHTSVLKAGIFITVTQIAANCHVANTPSQPVITGQPTMKNDDSILTAVYRHMKRLKHEHKSIIHYIAALYVRGISSVTYTTFVGESKIKIIEEFQAGVEKFITGDNAGLLQKYLIKYTTGKISKIRDYFSISEITCQLQDLVLYAVVDVVKDFEIDFVPGPISNPFYMTFSKGIPKPQVVEKSQTRCGKQYKSPWNMTFARKNRGIKKSTTSRGKDGKKRQKLTVKTDVERENLCKKLESLNVQIRELGGITLHYTEVESATCRIVGFVRGIAMVECPPNSRNIAAPSAAACYLFREICKAQGRPPGNVQRSGYTSLSVKVKSTESKKSWEWMKLDVFLNEDIRNGKDELDFDQVYDTGVMYDAIEENLNSYNLCTGADLAE